MMSSIAITPMNLNNGREGCYYAASPLTKPYFSMPNRMLMTPETAETKIQAPSARTVPTKSKSLSELNVAVPVTCVDLEDTDAAILDQVVTTNTVKTGSRSFIMSSIITLNDMDLDEAKSRESFYAASRLTKVNFSMANIMSMTSETTIQVLSATINPNGVENPDRIKFRDVGHLCETAGYRCCKNGPGGNHEHGQIYKGRSFWKRTKKFFRLLVVPSNCCCAIVDAAI
ncbi:unnamed protein product [Macrosiphum euphorbiae]|uniref:Uncharacterized protein n=1 Tax=Macrosiphum euphorbiae TaxID=13131 RepID=A0AAV0VJK7_9HEMI|nr:unnamed protein product [Macrosiphum euphorbiae]